MDDRRSRGGGDQLDVRSTAGLEALIGRAVADRRLPPVDDWNPPACGDLDIRISSDGSWSYLGTPIRRDGLVRLFSTVLRRDADGRHYLVTPAEKIGIIVEDAPFIAVELEATGAGRGQTLTLRTNVGDLVEVGPDHPLRFATDAGSGGVRPYVRVRGRLEARLARPLLYRLVDVASTAPIEGTDWFGVWSGGAFFRMMPADELERLSDGG